MYVSLKKRHTQTRCTVSVYEFICRLAEGRVVGLLLQRSCQREPRKGRVEWTTVLSDLVGFDSYHVCSHFQKISQAAHFYPKGLRLNLLPYLFPAQESFASSIADLSPILQTSEPLQLLNPAITTNEYLIQLIIKKPQIIISCKERVNKFFFLVTNVTFS